MYTVLIQKNDTLEVREHKDESDFDSDYMWVDGNYACDCNRALFFARAKGEPDPDETPCGNMAYTALCAVLPSGEVVMLDSLNEAPPEQP